MKLFLIHVGFYDLEIGIYEQHSVYFVAAADAREAKKIMKNKDFFIKKRMHIDGIQEIQTIDGYDVKLEKSAQSDRQIIFGYDQVKTLE